MDQVSMTAAAAACAIIMMITSMLLYNVSRNERYLFDWMIAAILFSIYGVIAICSAYLETHRLIFPAAPNALYMAGFTAIYSGVSQLTLKRSHWKLVASVLAISYLVQLIPAVIQSVNLRLLIFYPFLIFINSLSFYILWKHRKQEDRNSFILLMIVLFIFTLQLIIRGVVIAFGEKLEIFGSEFIQTSGTLALVCLFFMLTISFAFVSFWKKEAHLRALAITDHLTGWLNRTVLNSISQNMKSECLRNDSCLGFMLIDIDNFKSINDKYGHSVGDTVIKEVCDRAKSNVRACDYAFRLGGEEFLILIKNADNNLMENLSNRILKKISCTEIDTGSDSLKVTVSIGYSLCSKADKSWECVLERADQALYHSKESGKNTSTDFNMIQIA